MIPYVDIPAEGGQRDFDVPFPFLSRDHIVVRVNNNITPPLEWPTSARLRLPFLCSTGDIVSIERVTPVEQALVKFQDGNVLTAEDLNKAVLQTLYRQQEIAGQYDRSIGAAFVRLAIRGSVPIESEAVLDDIAQTVVTDTVLAEFQANIANITQNAVDILGLTDTVNTQGINMAAISADAATLRSDLDTLTGVVDSLAGGDPGTGIATLIADETNARIAGDTAMVNTVALIGAKSADGLSFIADLNKLKVSPTESFGQRFSALQSSIDANAASVASEATARADGDSANASLISALDARVGSNEAAIVAEQTARANADTAEANARTTLAATLQADYGALISNEATARANADTTMANTVAKIGALNPTGTAFILNENLVQMTAGGSLATRLSGLDSAIANANAAIVTEQTTRANADGALSSSISSLTTTVNGHTATISTVQTSLNGLQARYGVQLDVNGYITGFVQNNNGSTGSFTVKADKFSVVMPGVGARQVFGVDATGAYFTGNVRVDGSLLVTGSVQTVAMPQNTVSNSAYFQTASGGSLSGFTIGTWTDFNTSSTGGSTGTGGGTGGGGFGDTAGFPTP